MSDVVEMQKSKLYWKTCDAVAGFSFDGDCVMVIVLHASSLCSGGRLTSKANIGSRMRVRDGVGVRTRRIL